MKRFVTSFLLMTVVAFAFAQKVNVTGSVIDRETKTAVPQATVQLLNPKDSSFVAGAVSGNDGRFSVQGVSIGNYVAKVSFIGYVTQTRNVSVTAEKHHIGSFRMAVDAIMLKEAVVTAQAAKVQVVEDTVVYNAAAFRIPEGSALEELVKKLPGAKVAEDGSITINGKSVSKIMVDGKEFFSSDTKVAMKNLPVEMVEKIKAYEKKSDQARITGIDDGEEETVLDLTVKKDMKKGWFGNFDLSAGTKHRYSEKLMVNRFRDNQQISVFGSANNTGDRGFAGGGFGGSNGLQANKNIGINYAQSTKKLEVGGNVRYSHTDGDVKSDTYSERLSAGTTSYSKSLSSTLSCNGSFGADFRLEWKPNDNWNILLRPTFSYSESESTRQSSSATFKIDPYELTNDPLEDVTNESIAWGETDRVNRNISKSLSTGNNLKVGTDAQINRKLGKEGRNITARGSISYSDSESEQYDNSQINYFQLRNFMGLDSVYYRNQYYNAPNSQWTYYGQIGYSEPIFKGGYLQLTYRYTYKTQDNSKNTYDVAGYTGEFGSLPAGYANSLVDTLSNSAEYRNYINDITMMLRIVKSKFRFNIGAVLQPQSSNMLYTKAGKNYDIKRNVTNFSPRMDFRYRFTKTHQLRLTYRGNTSQPSMTYLLPITDYSNPTNIKFGNATLLPSFTNNFRLMYNNYNTSKQSSIVAFINASFSKDDVARTELYNSTNGVTYTGYDNINGNWNGSVNLNYNVAFLDNKLTLNSSSSARYQNYESYTGEISGVDVSDIDFYSMGKYCKQYSTQNSTLAERLSFGYRNNWLDVTANGSINYSHSVSEAQKNSNNQNIYDYSYGLNANFTLPWSITLSSDINNNFRRGYSESSMNTNELVWNAQVSKNFLKGNAATITLQVFDILGKQSNLSRSISATSRQDSRYNSINSYCMLHFIYRLNIIGSKAARDKMRERYGDFPTGGRGGGRPMGPPPGGGRF